MAGDRLEMAKASQLMVHRSQGVAIGNVDAMFEVAGVLEQIDSVMAGVYAARSGVPLDQIVAMMRAESFIAAEDAVALGLADALIARDATPPPARAASKLAVEHSLRELGLSRSVAGRAAGAAWATIRNGNAEPEPEIDLNAIANAIAKNVATHTPRRTR